MESNPPQKSKPKPNTRMLVGRRLQSRLRMEDQEEGESSTCSTGPWLKGGEPGWGRHEERQETPPQQETDGPKWQAGPCTSRQAPWVNIHCWHFTPTQGCIITSHHPEGETTSSLHLSPVSGPPVQISRIRLQFCSLESLNKIYVWGKGVQFDCFAALKSCCAWDISALEASNLFGHFSLAVHSTAKIHKDFPRAQKFLNSPWFLFNPRVTATLQGLWWWPHHLEGDTMNINDSFCHPRPEGKHAGVTSQEGNITATAAKPGCVI